MRCPKPRLESLKNAEGICLMSMKIAYLQISQIRICAAETNYLKKTVCKVWLYLSGKTISNIISDDKNISKYKHISKFLKFRERDTQPADNTFRKPKSAQTLCIVVIN